MQDSSGGVEDIFCKQQSGVPVPFISVGGGQALSIFRKISFLKILRNHSFFLILHRHVDRSAFSLCTVDSHNDQEGVPRFHPLWRNLVNFLQQKDDGSRYARTGYMYVHTAPR